MLYPTYEGASQSLIGCPCSCSPRAKCLICRCASDFKQTLLRLAIYTFRPQTSSQCYVSLVTDVWCGTARALATKRERIINKRVCSRLFRSINTTSLMALLICKDRCPRISSIRSVSLHPKPLDAALFAAAKFEKGPEGSFSERR